MSGIRPSSITSAEVAAVIKCTIPGCPAPELLRRALFTTPEDWQDVRESVLHAIKINRVQRMNA